MAFSMSTTIIWLFCLFIFCLVLLGGGSGRAKQTFIFIPTVVRNILLALRILSFQLIYTRMFLDLLPLRFCKGLFSLQRILFTTYSL